MTTYRILGINDEVTACECCGKANLKCTVVLTNGEGEVHFGRDCAARALCQFGRPKTARAIENEARYGKRPTVSKPLYYPNGKVFA